MKETIGVTSTSPSAPFPAMPPATTPISTPPAASGPPPTAPSLTQRYDDTLLDAAARYAEERHWDVFPGTWLEVVDGAQRCSCGTAACPAPGAHAAREDWSSQATGSPTVARRLWEQRPTASVLLPTGRTFDVLDASETAGLLALARMERMELTPGPVTRTPLGRLHFFVLPGAAAKLPGLLRQAGWGAGRLDLTALGEGGYVPAPPTRYGGRGVVQWVSPPTSANRWLPDVTDILAPLAYACGREARL